MGALYKVASIVPCGFSSVCFVKRFDIFEGVTRSDVCSYAIATPGTLRPERFFTFPVFQSMTSPAM